MSDLTYTYSDNTEYIAGTRVTYLGKYYLARLTTKGNPPSLLNTETNVYETDYIYWEQTFSFLDVLKENSPRFLFEDLPDYKINKIEDFYSNFANFLDLLYLRIKNLNNQLSIDTSNGPFLYELAYLLGLDDIVQLSKYLNSDGTINTDIISEATYYQQVANQKMRMKTALSFYLQKGTIKAFQNVFTGYGGFIKIIELWEKYSSDVFDVEIKDTAGDSTWYVVSGDGILTSDKYGSFYYNGGIVTEVTPPTWDSDGNVLTAGVYETTEGTLVFPLSGYMFDTVVFKGEEGLTKDIIDNSLFTRYSSTILFNYSGGEYSHEIYDIQSELSTTGYPEVSAGLTIKQYQSNEKNYYFILSTDGRLLYKTNDDSLSDYIPNSYWSLFKSDVNEFILSDDFILLSTSGDNLEIYENTLETYAVSGNDGITYATSGSITEDGIERYLKYFSIDNNNCYFVKPIDNTNDGHGRLILDRGQYIDLRRLDDFFLLNTFTKPVTGEFVEFAVEKNDDEYLLIYTNGKGSIITGLNSSASMISTLYDLTSYNVVNAYNRKYNNITLLCNSSAGDSYIGKFTFSNTNNLSTPTFTMFVSGSEILDETRFFEKSILLLENNELGVYDIVNDTTTYSQLPIISAGAENYNNLFFVDEINIYDSSNPSLLYKILAWNVGTTTLYKTHYFDAKVLRTAELLQFLPEDRDVINLINTLKPLHTKLRNIIFLDDLGVFGYGHFGSDDPITSWFGYGEYGTLEKDMEDIGQFG